MTQYRVMRRGVHVSFEVLSSLLRGGCGDPDVREHPGSGNGSLVIIGYATSCLPTPQGTMLNSPSLYALLGCHLRAPDI